MLRIECNVDVQPHVLLQVLEIGWQCDSGWQYGRFVCIFTEENRITCKLEELLDCDVIEFYFMLENYVCKLKWTETFNRTKASK